MFKTFSSLAIVSAVLCACGTSSPNGNRSAADTTGFPSVETKNPNTDYKPAFAGQTRVGGVKTTAAWEGVAITSGLTKPWGVTALPDGRLLVTQKEGTMRIVTTAGQVSEPITGLPQVSASGQGGLLGVTTDPEFATNRMVYWAFSEPVQGGTLTSVGK